VAWDLGYGWGFSYLLGAYFDYSSPVAWSDTSLNQRFALSYAGNNWSLTANVIGASTSTPSRIGLNCRRVRFRFR
jgi:hypothetical protein